MASFTTNYNLYKWLSTDAKVTTINEINSNATKLDTALKGLDDRIKEVNLKSFNAWVDVKGSGAKGDGFTDDSTAIQTAINNSPVGSAILFPYGTYMVSKKISLLPNRAYVGHGWGSTIKQMNNANLANIVDLGDTTTQHPNIIIKDLQIDGNKANNTTGVGLYLFGLLNSFLYRVRVQNCNGNGIFFEGSGAIQNSTNHIVDSWAFSNGGYGLYFSGNSLDNHVFGGDYGGNGSSGIYLAGVSSSIRDATVWGSLTGNTVVVAGVSNQLTCNNIEGGAGHGLEIMSAHNFIIGNKIYDNANVPSSYGLYDGILVNGTSAAPADNNVIVGNNIYAGLYANTGYYRWAINLGTYHNNCEVNANATRFAKSNGVINNARAINGIKSGDYYNGVLMTTTATRPTTANYGQMAYDMTTNKPIWFYNTNWRDATGTIV